ncbi:MAG: CapA family protein, partial [Myxococcota bacterium]
VRYNSPPSYLRAFQDGAGGHLFDALSTANNHTLDFGDRGALETTAVLDEMGIPHSGVRERADARRWVEAQAGEFRVGFVAATFGVNYPDDLAQSRIALSRVPGLAPEGDALPDLGELEEDLRDMDAAEIDFRVVSIHWGFEYECYPTARMMQTARRLVQAGADLVMGHHPHLQHPLEMLWVNQTSGVDDPAAARHLALTSELEDPRGPPRRGLVAYSLGNFTTTMVTHACKLAVLLSVSLERDAVSGRARLRAPHTRWFYNIAPFAGRGAKTRRLVPVEALERAHPAIAAAKKMKHHVDGTEP